MVKQPALTLRAPKPTDLPPLYTLAEDHKHKFLDDYHDFDLEYAQKLLNDPHTLIIDEYDYAVGVFWFDETVDDLHTSIHILVKPEYWKQVRKQEIVAQAIDWAFENIGVARIYAYPLDIQKSALKLLKQHYFYSHKPYRSYTKVNGIRVDLLFHELKRTAWEKHRNGLIRRQ